MKGVDVLTDRRTHDPFAPFTSAVESNETPAQPTGRELDDLLKSELIALAEQYGVPSYGNKQDLIDRLRAIPSARF